MRIAIFSESYHPVVNGVSVSVGTLVDGLSARGHDVHVFASRFRGFNDTSGNVYRFPSFHSRFNPDYPFPSPYSPGLKSVFKRLKPDVVHTHTPYCLGLAGMRWAKESGIPLISTNHTLYLEYAHYVRVIPQVLTRFALANHMRKYYSACSTVVVPSSATERQLRELGVTTPVEVIPTGVNPERFHFLNMRESIRKSLGIPESSVVMLYVGRVALEKNLRLLLESFALVASRVNNVHLVVVGGGPYESDARILASSLGLSSRVTFTGMKPHSDLGPMYSAGDVFVFPSATDTQGIALIEAMVAGLPCIVVRAGGCPEMVADGVSGLICDNSVESYAAGLEKIASDASLRSVLASGAVKHGQGYTVDAMVEKMERVYLSVACSSVVAQASESESLAHGQDRLNVKG